MKQMKPEDMFPRSFNRLTEGKYILKYRKPLPCDNLKKWGTWFKNAHRRVRGTQINNNIFVSTVFLGLDHGWNSDVPILFETMIFKNGTGEDCYRCATWKQALKQHWFAVEYCRKAKECIGLIPDGLVAV